MDKYPDTSSTVSGTVVVEEAEEGGIIMYGTLVGLEASKQGGIHIHEGMTCADKDKVGGHYFPGMPSDIWTSTTYKSDANGAARIWVGVPDFPMAGSSLPVA